MAANAKTAVISVFLSTDVTRRSIEWVSGVGVCRLRRRLVGPAGRVGEVVQRLFVERGRHLVAPRR